MKVLAERIGNRIYVRTNTSGKDEFELARITCKTINGAKWSKRARAWTYPLDLETARQIRDAFEESLVIGDELVAWGHEERKRENKLLKVIDVKSIDTMKVIDLPSIRKHAPGMWEAMTNRPFQPVASYYMAQARQCLNGDQPGIGKTIETLGALIEMNIRGPVLVLAPRTSVRSVWVPEVERWFETLDIPWSLHAALGTKVAIDKVYKQFAEACAHDPEGVHLLVCNAEQVRIKRDTLCPADICNGDEDWCPELDKHENLSVVRKPFLHMVEWSAIIADETHRWLINVSGKSATQTGYGFTKLKSNPEYGGVRFALTGTPLKGKRYNLWGTLRWIRPMVYTSKWRWINQYFQTVEDGYSVMGKPTNSFRYGREEAFFRALNGIMIRRTKSELRAINPDWMPPDKLYHDIWLNLEGPQATHYKAMERSAEVILQGGRLGAVGILAEMTRLKQFALSDGVMEDGHFKPTLPSAKYDWLLQFIDERGIDEEPSDDVRKVVVASQFTSVLNIIAADLRDKGIKVLMITGETKQPENEASAFQNDDEYRLMLINTKAGGVSITLDAADDIVLLDETWVPDDQEQVEDRVHRASNVKHQVDVWYLRTKGSIEEGIAQTNYGKAENNHVVLDSQRGLKFAAERFGAKATGKAGV